MATRNYVSRESKIANNAYYIGLDKSPELWAEK
jgi:hypothetical protein